MHPPQSFLCLCSLLISSTWLLLRFKPPFCNLLYSLPFPQSAGPAFLLSHLSSMQFSVPLRVLQIHPGQSRNESCASFARLTWYLLWLVQFVNFHVFKPASFFLFIPFCFQRLLASLFFSPSSCLSHLSPFNHHNISSVTMLLPSHLHYSSVNLHCRQLDVKCLLTMVLLRRAHNSQPPVQG